RPEPRSLAGDLERDDELVAERDPGGRRRKPRHRLRSGSRGGPRPHGVPGPGAATGRRGRSDDQSKPAEWDGHRARGPSGCGDWLLSPDTALVVWADGSGFLRFWQRIGGVPPSESTGDVNAAGGVPFLAARTGSPQIPLAEWTYLQYMAHDQIPSNMTATVLDRLQSAGSTNLVNLAILLDAGGNPSHATDFYVKRLGRTALQDHGELNMGDQTTLEEFIARTVERYPARGEYILALDDHGNGWRGACSDNHPTTGDWLEPSELRGALTSANLTFQLALFNGCLMANVETAYQVEGFVRFLIASQEAM